MFVVTIDGVSAAAGPRPIAVRSLSAQLRLETYDISCRWLSVPRYSARTTVGSPAMLVVTIDGGATAPGPPPMAVKSLSAQPRLETYDISCRWLLVLRYSARTTVGSPAM